MSFASVRLGFTSVPIPAGAPVVKPVTSNSQVGPTYDILLHTDDLLWIISYSFETKSYLKRDEDSSFESGFVCAIHLVGPQIYCCPIVASSFPGEFDGCMMIIAIMPVIPLSGSLSSTLCAHQPIISSIYVQRSFVSWVLILVWLNKIIFNL